MSEKGDWRNFFKGKPSDHDLADLNRAIAHQNTPNLAHRDIWADFRAQAGGSFHSVAEQMAHNSDQILRFSTPEGLAEYALNHGISENQALVEIEKDCKNRENENIRLSQVEDPNMPYSVWYDQNNSKNKKR